MSTLERNTDIIQFRAGEARRFIDKYSLAACPEVYSVVYAFVARSDAMILEAVTNLIRKGKVTDDALLELSVYQDRERHLNQLPHIMDKIIGSVTSMAADILTGRERISSAAQDISLATANKKVLGQYAARLLEATSQVNDSINQGKSAIDAGTDEVRVLKQKLEETEAQLETDTLTGAGSRLAMERQLQRMQEVATRLTHGIAIAMIDVDNFKKINDTHGHRVGDQTLRLVAENLSRDSGGLYPYTVNRYGGEEFVLIFDDAPMEKVFTIVDNIRDALSRRNIVRKDTRESIGAVTISVGVLHLSPQEIKRTEWDPEVFLDRADKAMYQAKQSGKDRVKVSPSILTIDMDSKKEEDHDSRAG